jgi:hypothetical protein
MKRSVTDVQGEVLGLDGLDPVLDILILEKAVFRAGWGAVGRPPPCHGSGISPASRVP